MAPAAPELDILRPRDPSLDDDSDCWEEFTIRDATVHESGDENALVSLLVAEAGFPLTVRGELERLDEPDYDLYLHDAKSYPRPIHIVVENVRQFAFGQDDGFSAIWAAGKSGWHRLQPAKKYKKIYDDMCEAVSVLYFVADAYKTERFEGRGKNRKLLKDYTAQELFAKYARDVLDTEDVEEAAERIYRHKDFLISSMLAGREGLAWSKYSLTKHLYKKFPDTVTTLRRRREALPESEAPAAKSRHTRAQSSDTTSAAASKPTRTRSTRQNSVEPQAKAASRSDDVRVRTTRQGSVETSSTLGSRGTRRGRAARTGKVEVISLDGTSDADGTIPEEPEEEDMEVDEELVAVMAPPKAKSMPSRRTRKNPNPVEPEPEHALEILATPAKDEESDEEIRAREQKNKSSLRPRASKASKSTSRNGGKGPREQIDEGEDEPDPPSSPLPGKRKHANERNEVGRRKPKRRDSRPHDDEGIDIPTSPDSSGADVDLPLRLSEVAHMEDPVQEDTWVCALDGCTHKVYASSHPDSQRLIREHYALHAYDDDERVQMVKKIEAPSLPVSRLMEKVKMRAKADGFPSSAASAPSMPENVRSRFGIAGQVGVVQKY
ncbi:hypothetical protein Slin14017_G124540 [Septoria linicola]|nr:hypothetical protein Slin14017_G124540 [Septoria linicola]